MQPIVELSRSAAGIGAGLIGFHRRGFSCALGPGRVRHDLPIPTTSARGAFWPWMPLGASAFRGHLTAPIRDLGRRIGRSLRPRSRRGALRPSRPRDGRPSRPSYLARADPAPVGWAAGPDRPPGGPPGVAWPSRPRHRWPGRPSHHPRRPAPWLGLPAQEGHRAASPGQKALKFHRGLPRGPSPAGTKENSPALQRWVCWTQK